MEWVDFHLHQELIAGQDADSHRSSSASLLTTRELGREAVHGSPRGAVGTLLEEGTVCCWEWVGAKAEKGFFEVRWASGRSRRSFGKCQQCQEWGRTWWASRVALKWRRVGCCSQRQGIIRPGRIIIPPVTPVLNREEGSVTALPATLWSGPETPVAFGQNLWGKKKSVKEFFFFCLKVHWRGLGEGKKGEQSACEERDQGSIAVREKKDRNQEGKHLKIASLCVIMGELEESESCLSVPRGDLELKSSWSQFNVLLELMKVLPCWCCHHHG